MVSVIVLDSCAAYLPGSWALQFSSTNTGMPRWLARGSDGQKAVWTPIAQPTASDVICRLTGLSGSATVKLANLLMVVADRVKKSVDEP
jgi:hypothetical protein